MESIQFYVNDTLFEVKAGDPALDFNLLQFLREQRFTGSKQVCAEGGCGACTVILSEYQNGKVHSKSVAACLVPLPSLDSHQVVTIEGLKLLSQDELHPVCDAFFQMGASQCGFCTPGFIMSLLGKLENTEVRKAELENVFDGNLCRCTGYRPIMDAAAVFCKDPIPEDDSHKLARQWQQAYENTHPLSAIFPEEFKITQVEDKVLKGRECQWQIPRRLKTAVEGLSDNSKIISGNTDVGYLEHDHPQHFTEKTLLNSIPELREIKVHESSIEIGAGVTISQMIEELNDHPHLRVKALLNQCRYFANNQIRNMATVGGGLVNFSSYSDLVPVWVASNAKIHIQGKDAIRQVLLQDFYDKKGQLRFELKKKEILRTIEMPLGDSNHVFTTYKYARRRMDSITFLSAACLAKFDNKTQRASEVILCFDGLGQTAVRATETETYLKGISWDSSNLNQALSILQKELEGMITHSLPEKLKNYQKRLAQGVLLRFFAEADKQYFKNLNSEISGLTNRYPQVAHRSHTQFEEKSVGVIGKAIPHQNAKLQTTGQARYSLDQEAVGSVYAAVITSPVAYGNLKKIDPSQALKHPDVIAVLTAKDIPGTNKFGFRLEDEEFLASNTVGYVGQPLAVLVAKSQDVALEWSQKVDLEIEELPALLSVEQAFKAQSFHGRKEGYLVKQGNTDESFKNCDSVIEGELRAGGQSHFYLEPQSALVIPRDPGSFIYASTQSPSNVVDNVSRILNTSNNQVEVKVGRLGGGFGGKQLRAGPIAALAALAAHKTGKPVKLALTREQDMAFCPGRSPIEAKYKAGFDKSGKLQALKIHFGLNGGWTSDYSADIAETATLLMDSCYQIPNVHIHGFCLKMNYGSFTSTRGFGKPQATAIIESVLDHGASVLKIDPTELRQMNIYQPGDLTITRTKIKDDVMNTCWQRLMEKVDYQKTLKEIDEFNKKNTWVKRGVAALPSRGNMGFIESNDINRGIAVVQILHDGSVTVNHSGCEMGQGINTRMAQVAAHYLQVPMDKITVTDTQTALIPNTPPTTMVATDLIGKAIIEACKELLKELAQFPGSYQEKVEAVYQKGGKLQATGIYTAPRLAYDYEKQEGDISYFFVWGAAFTLAEVDLISGNFRLLESKVVQDCGKSLNPHLDIGQAEGGFMFGVGYYTLEEMIYSPSGKLISNNVSGYKIPSCGDVPLDWDIELMNYAPAGEGLHNAKGIGEANTQLGLSAFFAIKDAVRRARKEAGHPNHFELNFPASVDRVTAELPSLSELLKQAVKLQG